jgi:hypothetical protein
MISDCDYHVLGGLTARKRMHPNAKGGYCQAPGARLRIGPHRDLTCRLSAAVVI